MSSSVGSLALGGLVSGMDTDTIVQKMQAMEQAAIDQQNQKKTDLQAKHDAWDQVKTSLTSLRSAMDGIRFAGPFTSRTVTSTDNTVVTGTAAAGTALGTHTINVTDLAQAEVVGGGNLLTSATSPVSAMNDPVGTPMGTGTLTINGQNVSVTAQDSLYTIRDKINATPNVGVTAGVTTVTQLVNGSIVSSYELTLTSQTSGTAGAINFAGSTNELLYGLGLSSTSGSITNTDIAAAKDATFTLDNQPTTFTSGTNTITSVPGVTLTLTGKGPATFTIGQNTDQAATNVQTFVDALNSTFTLLSQLTAYNGTGQAAGVLNGDSTARNIQTSLRSMLSTQVGSSSNPYNNLGAVGVTTGAYGTTDYGKVLFDKTKLIAALSANETAVGQLFGGIHNTTVVGQSTGWTSSSPLSAGTQTLSVPFAAPSSIDQVTLTTPDGATNPTTGLKDFTLSYQDSNGNWNTLATVTSFTGWNRTFGFSPVLAKAVKVDVTSTYDNGNAQISQLNAYAQNTGTATSMYNYLNSTLAYSTGPIDSLETNYDSQIKALDDKISQMTDKMNTDQANLKAQFANMEQSLSQLRAQGSQLSAMLGQSTSGQ